MQPLVSVPITSQIQFVKKKERNECNEIFDPYKDETTDDDETDGDSICSDASDIETVDTQKNASGPSIVDTSLLSDESTFVHLEDTFNPVDVSGFEENEQDLGTSIQQNLEEVTDIVNGVPLSILGKKYKPKLIQTKQYPNGPDPKVCPICNSSMDWRTSGTIMGRKNKSGVLTHYTYGTAHSGDCAKEAYSDKNSAKAKESHQRIMDEASRITDPVLSETHKMKSNQYRLSKEKMEASKSGERCFACSAVDGLVLVGSYWFCEEHKEKQKERDQQMKVDVAAGRKCHSPRCSHSTIEKFFLYNNFKYCSNNCLQWYLNEAKNESLKHQEKARVENENKPPPSKPMLLQLEEKTEFLQPLIPTD